MTDLDPEIIAALEGVTDPEVGIDLADLGLVYRAVREADRIAVDITLTTRACPLAEMIMEDIRLRLGNRFPDVARIDVNLVWDPLWNPGLITGHGRALLGY